MRGVVVSWLAAVLLAAPAEAGVADGAIRIGILNDQSGPYADYGGKGSVVAAMMAAEDFGGRVLGVPVVIVAADHRNRPDLAASIARRWYDADHVDAIMELTGSAVALAVQAIARDRKKIDIVTGATTLDLTGAACSPYGFSWVHDTHALAVGAASAGVRQGGDRWFFITADYAFGDRLQEEATAVIRQGGGSVVGSARHPLGAADFSAALAAAQRSKAKFIALADSGRDAAGAIRQAHALGVAAGGQQLVALLFTRADVVGLGLPAAESLTMTEGWYWNLNDETRAFARRFRQRFGKMPDAVHAGTYSAVLQYLKALARAGTDDADAVAKELHELPVNDVFAHDGRVGANGRMIHDIYRLETRRFGESDVPGDDVRLAATIAADEAFLRPEDSGCPLVAPN